MGDQRANQLNPDPNNMKKCRKVCRTCKTYKRNQFKSVRQSLKALIPILFFSFRLNESVTLRKVYEQFNGAFSCRTISIISFICLELGECDKH